MFEKGKAREQGAGRPKGAKSKRTIELNERAHKAVLAGLTPLEYMLGVLRNPKEDQERRDDMAKAAAPYCHPKLVAQANTNKDVTPEKPGQTAAELRAEILQDMIRAGYLKPDVMNFLTPEARAATGVAPRKEDMN